MFKSKPTLQSTLGKVNQFIEDLKAGIDSHIKEVESINEQINDLCIEKDSLATEISHATRLIGTLSGTNS